jgi:hypothetical protein
MFDNQFSVDWCRIAILVVLVDVVGIVVGHFQAVDLCNDL